MVSERDKSLGFARRALRTAVYEAFGDITVFYWQQQDWPEWELKPSDIYDIVVRDWGDEMGSKYIEWFNANYDEEDWR